MYGRIPNKGPAPSKSSAPQKPAKAPPKKKAK